MANPLISALPPAPSRLDDPANFSTKADALVAALPAFVAEANILGAYLDALATAAGTPVPVSPTPAPGATPVPAPSTATTSSSGLPLGTFAYWQRGTPTPSGHLVFDTIQVLPRGSYPELDAVIPVSITGFASRAPQILTSTINGHLTTVLDGEWALSISNGGSGLYFYRRSGSTWSLFSTLTGTTSAGVSLSGARAIVPVGTGNPVVYFFNGNLWAQEATITNPETGKTVSWSGISGDTAVLGLSAGAGDGVANAGSAYVFVRSGTTWAQQARLVNPAPAAGGLFGDAVAISGDTAVVGARGRSNSTGEVYVFVRSGTTWTLQATLANPTPSTADEFGRSVDIDGDYVIVGEIGEDASASNSGAAHIFLRTGTTWSLQQTLRPAVIVANQNFGSGVSISGARACVFGAGSSGNPTGKVYFYTRVGTTWSLEKAFDQTDSGISAGFSNVNPQNRFLSGDWAACTDNTLSPSRLFFFNGPQVQATVLQPLPASPNHQTIVRVGSFVSAPLTNSYITAPNATPAIGSAFEGGFYAGMVWGERVQSPTSQLIATGTKVFDTAVNMTTTPLFYSGQIVEVRSRANPANKMVGVVVGASGTTLTVNVTSVGGSGTFNDWSVMCRFRCIVSPKASGETINLQFRPNSSTVVPDAALTLTEGFDATLAMAPTKGGNSVFAAAQFCRDLSIGGFADWYLPALNELELAWRNLKPVTDDNATGTWLGGTLFPSVTTTLRTRGSLGISADAIGLNDNSTPLGAAYTATNPAKTTVTAFQDGGAEALTFQPSGTANFFWSSTKLNGSLVAIQEYRAASGGTPNAGRMSAVDGTGTGRVRAFRRSVI